MKNRIETIAATIVLIALLSINASANDYMAVQGSVNFTGVGNITFTIWNQSTSGSSVYNSGSDYNGAISNGRYDILLGDSGTALSLEYGKVYYLDISINGQDLDFNGNERQEFQSNTGNITSTTIAANSIPKTKISSSSTWTESEIPALTSSWSGTINASKIVSQLLLNVNSSVYLGTYTASDLLGFDAGLGSRIDSLNLTKSGIGTCSAGQFVNQTTATGVLCQTPGAASDMNNYTSSISISGNVITLSRIGMNDISATLSNNIITLDAINITNKASLANTHTLDSNNITNKANLANTLQLSCNNITGATSNLCTLTDTNSGGDITDIVAGYGINITSSGGPAPSITINRTVLDSLYYSTSNPNSYITTDTNDSARVNSINSSLLIQTARIDSLNASSLTDTNDSARVNSLNASLQIQTSRVDSVNSSLQGVNSSANIVGLGFYTTGQVNTISTNLQTNISSVSSIATAQTTQINNIYSNITSINSTSLQVATAISTYVNRSLWTTIDNYPTGCGAGQYVITIGDTLTCGTPTANNNSITLDAGFNLTNKAGLNNAITLDSTNITNQIALQNKTLLSCSNITGAASNLCTLTDTNSGGDITDIVAGYGINITSSGGPSPSITINRTVLDSLYYSTSNPNSYITTDTNDSARVNSINSSLLIQTARIDSVNTTLQGINNSGNFAAFGFITSYQFNISNGSTSTQINNNTRINITGGTGISIQQTGTDLVIASTSTLVDTNDSARVNSINTSLVAINTSSNIVGLGFYTSTQTNTIATNLQTNITNANTGITTHTTQIAGLYTNLTGVNSSTNIVGLGFYTSTQTNTIATNLQANISSVNSSSLQATAAISTYVNRSLWTTIDNYPSGCGAGQYVITIGDTLTCSTPTGTSNAITLDAGLNLTNKAGLNNAITLDAGLNLTNKAGLANSHTIDAINITNKAGLANSHTIDAINLTNKASMNNSITVDAINITNKIGLQNSTLLDANNITNVAGFNNEITLHANNITSGTFGNERLGNASVSINTLNVTGQAVAGKALTYSNTGQLLWEDLPLFNHTTTDYSTTSATIYVVLTNLTNVLAGNSSYIVSCNFITYSAAATTGEQLQLNLTGSPTTSVWSYNSQVSTTTRTSFQGTSASTNAFADTGSAGTNIRDITQLAGYVVTGASDVTLTYAMKSEVGGSNAVYASGSNCRYTRVR